MSARSCLWAKGPLSFQKTPQHIESFTQEILVGDFLPNIPWCLGFGGGSPKKSWPILSRYYERNNQVIKSILYVRSQLRLTLQGYLSTLTGEGELPIPGNLDDLHIHFSI